MAKITTTIAFTQGEAKATIDEDNFLVINSMGCYVDGELSKGLIAQKAEDLLSVIEAVRDYVNREYKNA